MNWLAITFFAYFFLSLEIILDKFLLSSRRVSHPALYTFYSAAAGLFALVFIPFGFHAIGYIEIIYRLIGGIIFICGMLALFSAIAESEASRVTPVVGATVPITTFFLSLIFLGENFAQKEILGLIALIFGGLLISLDFEQGFIFFPGFKKSIAAGILLAIAATIFKEFYKHDNFINVYIWTRMGAFCGALVFFLIPSWRKIIVSSLLKFKKPKKENQKSGALYIISRILGGSGSILKEKATSLATASVTLVNALVSIEYVFVFILGIGFSLWMPEFFEEKKDWKTVAQKIFSILIITVGIALIFRHE
ncbi:MAG TPA: EamA family transporter [Candidatus Moranbacteria bacterium]|nr:EamA family transporter [Candidatus Moranbacteria bacterium]